MEEFSTSSDMAPWKSSIKWACVRFLQKALWRQGAASNDIVDTLAIELALKVEHLAEWANEQRGDWEIVERGIAYLSVHHDGPWKGTAWFVDSLTILIEIAVPNSGHDEDTAAFLLDMQRGANEAYQTAPISKTSLRLTDEAAKDIKVLQEAGCRYGLVSAILDMNEAMFHGESLGAEAHDLMLVAATAAPFVRQERRDRGIDE